jgi:hypothetical protein
VTNPSWIAELELATHPEATSALEGYWRDMANSLVAKRHSGHMTSRDWFQIPSSEGQLEPKVRAPPDTYPVFLVVFVHIYVIVSNLAPSSSRYAWETLEEDGDAIFLG